MLLPLLRQRLLILCHLLSLFLCNFTTMIVNYRSLTFPLLFFLSFSHGHGASHFLASQTPLPSGAYLTFSFLSVVLLALRSYFPLLTYLHGTVSEAETENVAVFAPDYNDGPSVAPVVDNNSESSSLVLAAKRTYRQDPLNGFRRYSGGWNIKDRHYWAVSSFITISVLAINNQHPISLLFNVWTHTLKSYSAWVRVPAIAGTRDSSSLT